MKVVILGGGYGSRISEESHLKPKPMLEIGDKPILWHIMKEYSYYGFNDFIICAGYKQYVIKEWFANYFVYNSDVTFDFSQNGEIIVHNNFTEPWKVTIIDTGLDTMTGGRVKRIEKFIDDESFMLTYGDGVSDIDICKLLEFHRKHGKIATILAPCISQRFGVLELKNNNQVVAFREKDNTGQIRINAGYMILKRDIFNYIDNDQTVLEKEPLERVARDGQLMAYLFEGFWQCMDTKREMDKLNRMWREGECPWKKWD